LKPINYTLPEIFINCGVESEDGQYLSGRYWGSSFDDEISGIPLEYRNVSDVFQTHRSGSNFAYTITGLLPYASYDVTLGFAENYEEYCNVGMRRFNVTVNNRPFEIDLDVYDTVGCFRALVLTKAYKATGDGTLVIQFKQIKRHPMISLIAIEPNGPITKVALCKAINRTEVMSLGNYDIIDLEAIGTNQLSIVVDAIPSVTRVRFRYNGEVHTEHATPYVINGDAGSDYIYEAYLSTNGNKTIWMDAFNDDKKTVASIRLDLVVIGADSFIVEEQAVDPVIAPDAPTTSAPSALPSDRPSAIPSDVPSFLPSDVPSDGPSSMPSDVPSDAPSSMPSDTPSAQPSSTPTVQPSDTPSGTPSDQVSSTPSDSPSSVKFATLVPSPSDQPSV
jgi:Malectin domain